MSLSSFKELLLKKATGHINLETLIKFSDEKKLESIILESLEKMAEDRRRPRASNSAVMHFGTHSLDESGDMANMVHDALSHHASHYKAALNAGQKGLAAQHMKKIHNLVHFGRKVGQDAGHDHGAGKLNIEAVDPKPWERSHYSKMNPATGEFTTDTKGWSRDSGDYSYLQGPPHESYRWDIKSHGHNGAYPLEEMKVNGKHLHIEDVDPKGRYVPHEFSDAHPIIAAEGKNTPMYAKSPKDVDAAVYEKYLKDVEDYNNGPHMDKYYDRHEKAQQANPEEYIKRGSVKPAPIHKDIPNKMEFSDKEEPGKITAPQKVVPAVDTSKIPQDELQNIANSLSPETLKQLGLHNLIGLKKSILDIKLNLLKNKDFLVENPEILESIKERLEKAKSDDADSWLRENDPDYQPESYADDVEEQDVPESEDGEPDFLDNPEQEDQGDDEDAQLLAEEKARGPQYQDIDTEEPAIPAKKEPIKEESEDEPSQEESTAKEPTKRSAYTDWKPREDYTPEQQAKIEAHVKEGYHPGDAEILAGAHRPMNIHQAVKSKIRPHEMSEKMHSLLKDIAKKHMDERKLAEYSQHIEEPEHAPVKATTASAIKNHAQLTQDYNDAKSSYEKSPEYSKMTPRERHKARKEWHEGYLKNNPDYEGSLASAAQSHSDTHKINTQLRQDKIEADKEAIAGAGQKSLESGGSASEGSQRYARGMDYDEEDPTSHQATVQGAYQSAGGISDEDKGMIGTSTITDPFHAFASKNPELKEQYTKEHQAKQQKLLRE
jgi:hypothetical protein